MCRAYLYRCHCWINFFTRYFYFSLLLEAINEVSAPLHRNYSDVYWSVRSAARKWKCTLTSLRDSLRFISRKVTNSKPAPLRSLWSRNQFHKVSNCLTKFCQRTRARAAGKRILESSALFRELQFYFVQFIVALNSIMIFAVLRDRSLSRFVVSYLRKVCGWLDTIAIIARSRCKSRDIY